MLPSFHTARLVIEPLRGDAVAALLAMERAVERGRRQASHRPDEALRERLSRWAAMADATLPAGTWVLRRDGTAVGRVAVDRPCGCDHASLSYALVPEVRGHGLATEAARALLDWVVRDGGVREARAVVRPDNHASIAVARRLGMTEHPDSDAANSVFAVRHPA